MKKHKFSNFKNIIKASSFFKDWVQQLEEMNSCKYESYQIKTELGLTHVWGINTDNKVDKEILIIFPGARTTSLIWDLDNGLEIFKENYKIFLIETNGLPNLSDGASPNIKTNDYGIWANQVLEGLNVSKAYILGASFGSLVAAKLAITNPEKVKKIFMLNPGCLQPFSLTLNNLFYNLIPIIWPSKYTIKLFLKKAILSKPNHTLSDDSEQLLINYELMALREYKDNTQKPYYMGEDLKQLKSKIHLLLGDKDILFPFSKSIKNAKTHFEFLENIIVFSNVGHGIETYKPAMLHIKNSIEQN